MDRYQEDIRRAAARGLSHLNLGENGSRGNNTSSTTTDVSVPSVSVAAARNLYLQKVSQLNNGSAASPAAPPVAAVQGRRRSAEPKQNGSGSAAATWRGPGTGLGKSKSASNVLINVDGANTMARLSTSSVAAARATSISPAAMMVQSNGTPEAAPSTSSSSFNDRVRALASSSTVASGLQGPARVLKQQDALSSNPAQARISSPVLKKGTSPDPTQQQQQQQFQPGTYPQLKRASLTNIPIYENVDGYPVLPRRGQPSPPPPPPPYTGSHQLLVGDSSSTLVKRDSRILSKSAGLGQPAAAQNGEHIKSILKTPMVPQPKGQPPYVAPPVYENIDDETILAAVGKRKKGALLHKYGRDMLNCIHFNFRKQRKRNGKYHCVSPTGLSTEVAGAATASEAAGTTAATETTRTTAAKKAAGAATAPEASRGAAAPNFT